MSNWPEINLSSPDAATHRLAERLDVSPFLAQLLRNRDISEADARWMLADTPELHWPTPPFLSALQALFSEIHSQGESIVIFGDYDADGLSGSSVLMTFLRGAGFKVDTLLPTRSQGYGLNTKTLQDLIEKGYRLLITVDCGISNREEIAFARAAGMQVVITDHHGLPDVLPEAEFTLHPEVLKIESLKNLSGAGMAYWLTCLLHPIFPEAPAPESLLDLAVIGTLADMTPLKGLNFALAKRGLLAAQRTERPGLLALGALKKVSFEHLTEDDLTFRMIPLLNAAGRIDSPMPALDLLMAVDEKTARTLAQELEELNTLRQQYCKDVLADALSRLKDHAQQTIVLADASWPHGVLGITCSQLVGQFHQPVVLLAIEGDKAKASIRAPKGYNVLEALQSCASLLLRFGGHEMAGGLTLERDKIPEFAAAFEAACVAQQGNYVHRVQVDMELNPRLLQLELWEDLRKLAPFGMGNPPPLVLSLKAPLKELHSDRKSETHLFAKLNQRVRVKGWGQWQKGYLKHKHFNLLYHLECNHWRGQKKLELNVQHIEAFETSSGPLTPKSPPSAPPKVTRPKTPPPALPRKSVSPPQKKNPSPRYELKSLSEKITYWPGYFYGQEQWWQVPVVQYQEETHWHDARHISELPEQAVKYALDCPAQAVIHRAEPGQFSGLALTGLPRTFLPPEIWSGFHDIYLLPAQPPQALPDFALLSRVLQHLSEQVAVKSDHELAQRMRLDRHRAKICLRSLCDLGLLTYDRERYFPGFKNQAYDLRKSQTYAQEKQRWEACEDMYKSWSHTRFDRLKNALIEKVEQNA